MFTRMTLSQICDTGHNGVDSVSSDACEVTVLIRDFLLLNSTSPLHVFMAIVDVFLGKEHMR